MRRRLVWCLVALLVLLVGCTENAGTSIHCFGQSVTQPSFVSANCPPVNSPDAAVGPVTGATP